MTGAFCLFPSREWNSVVLFFLSFFPSPYLRGGGGTEVQIFVFPGLTRFYMVLRVLSLFSCLTALSTLKHRRNFKVSHLRNKTIMSMAAEHPLHTAELWHWEGMWGAEVSEAVRILPQPCSTKGSSMVTADKYLCRACLVQGSFWYKVCFPRWGFQLGGCRWNPALCYNTKIVSLLLSVYKEGEGSANFL